MTVHQMPMKSFKPEPPKNNNLCINCKHCEAYEFASAYKCTHSENQSLVDGGPAFSIEKFRAKICKGKYWEKKPLEPVSRRPWWKFWRK